MLINVLMVGDIVGRPGRKILAQKLPSLIEERDISFVIVNAENAAGGCGVTPKIADELFQLPIDVLTSGDHIWDKKEIIPYIERNRRLLRPANYPPRAAGSGFGCFRSRLGEKIGVINLLGRVFMGPMDSPFDAADYCISELSGETKLIFVDFHAEATSEKVALGWFLNGRVTTVFGTHTHIQTADERLLDGGTAYITDVGMTGPYDSVIGVRKDRVLSAITTLMPASFEVARGDVRLAGILVSADTETGQAKSIERFQLSQGTGFGEEGDKGQ